MSHQNEYHNTDQHLVSRSVGGDRHAFGIIIKNTERLVTQLIFKMIPVPADRKDLAQDVFMKVYKNLPGFKFQSRLLTWVGQITYNTCLNYLDKKKVVLIDVRDDDDDNQQQLLDRLQQRDIARYDNEVERLLSAKELSVILNAGMDKLPPVYKTLLSLYHQEELSYAEISEITNLPEGTVKSYLFRARKALKKNLLTNYKREDL
ncbi:RNA polymerase sigma factor [Mucilaginibacter sp. FT3.2]|uniref:RNA polymerase sigma factor n=1 Tax=Mucilaginibacter sp. FT3.2 TaxID=2723090 RepID=UPI00160ECF39|nr:RNA polymerase sigma-70 factor (ECF subfamily) [Mucilaginibacter sp. FT3.2]